MLIITKSICVKMRGKHLKEIMMNILIDQCFQDCFPIHPPENRRQRMSRETAQRELARRWGEVVTEASNREKHRNDLDRNCSLD